MAEKKTRNRKPPTPEQKARSDFRKASDTHTLILELDVTHEDLRFLLSRGASAAYIKRRLNAYYRKRIEQYKRTRVYRETIDAYRKTNKKSEKKKLGKKLKQLQEQAGITEQAGKDQASYWAERCGIQAVFALSVFEDVWEGVEKILYGGSKKLGKKNNKRFSLRAKQANRGIIVRTTRRGKLAFSIENRTLYPMIDKDDLFARDEQDAICALMLNDGVEERIIKNFLDTGEIVLTYRPKYVTLVMEEIRGKWHVWAHIAVEGEVMPKKKKDGSPRFHRGVDGEVAVDLGTQSYAAVGANIFEMKNLAERDGKSIKDEKKLRRLQRHADRCLRACNPQNYNEDGTIKKGKKTWVYSKEYLRTMDKIRQYHRTCAVNRLYAIREDANRLREHGSSIICEKQSVKGWQASLFGKSIQSRCPGAFREELKRKFDSYVEVNIMYRASQYDHETGEYKKKKLSQRKHYHSEGRSSPRDGYSGFVLWCHDEDYMSPDRELCDLRFEDYLRRVSEFVSDCRRAGIRVANGGF